MKYRRLGKTGMEVSAIGLGCEERCPHGLPVVRMLRDALPPMREMLRMWEAAGLQPGALREDGARS